MKTGADPEEKSTLTKATDTAVTAYTFAWIFDYLIGKRFGLFLILWFLYSIVWSLPFALIDWWIWTGTHAEVVMVIGSIFGGLHAGGWVLSMWAEEQQELAQQKKEEDEDEDLEEISMP